MRRLDELSLKLLDVSIGEAEARELANLTETSDGANALRNLFVLESHLLCMGRSSVADSVVGKLGEQRCDRVEEGVMLSIMERSGPAGLNPIYKQFRQRMTASSFGIAVMVISLFFLLVWFGGNDVERVEIAQLKVYGEDVRIVADDGIVRSATLSQRSLTVMQNETVETAHATDSAEVVFADGTTIELLGSTSVTFSETADGSKQLQVLAGLIQATVSPQQEGRPLQIVTPTAAMEVLGTTLGVDVRKSSTQLEVATGVVAMTRKVDGKRVEVGAGHLITATHSADEPMNTRPFPELSSDWAEDFSTGLPNGWRRGEQVDVNDGHAVRATAGVNPGKHNNIAVTTQNAWREGNHALFEIHEDSVLHFRMSQSEFARITVMIGSRAYPPGRNRSGVNLFYTKKAWNGALEPDTWRTISIPLKDVGWHVRRGNKQGGAPDLDGLAAYLIQFTTMDRDVGLTIDRIWVTSDGE